MPILRAAANAVPRRLHWGALLACALSAPLSAMADEMNISQFVFRDINRNGVYDRGEPPFAGVPIRLDQQGRDPILRESNLAGFTNFPMSDDDATKDITAAGPVSFTVELPEGTVLTTGNPSQTATILSVPAAPGGFAMDPVNRFMGVASELTIQSNADGLAAMTCTAGDVIRTAVLRGDRMLCNVAPGNWRVDWTLTDGRALSREVTVQDWPIHVPVAPASAAKGAPVTLTFDDLITSQNIVELPSFDGFEFHNFVVAHHKFYGGWGYVNGTVSGEFSAYNSSGHPATITSDAPFGLQQVFLSVAWPGGTRDKVDITALRGGQVVARETLSLSNLGPVLFAPHWTDIDTIEIRHGAYWQVVMDDMVLTR